MFFNRKPQEILDSDMGFIEKIGLKEHLIIEQMACLQCINKLNFMPLPLVNPKL